jgi:uncharacterized protein (DUF697 family)
MRKPILIVGIGLSIGLGVWDFFQHSMLHLEDYSLMGAITLGLVFWSWRKNTQSAVASPLTISIDQKKVQEAIAQAQTTIKYLENEATNQDFSHLHQALQLITNSQLRENLQINITGDKRIGKTTLNQLLSQQNQNPNLFYFDSEETALDADLVIFLINGDLTASEAQKIGQSRDIRQRVLVTLNKQDQYSTEARSEILQKIKTSLNPIIPSNDIISTTASPTSIKVKKHLSDGTILEKIERQQPEISQLNNRLTEIINQEKQQLILATTWRQAKLLEKQAKTNLNQMRNKRSQPIIEQYQWLAAATAFANPVSALDLLATMAINGQMLVDLATIYQQKMTLEQAQTAAVTIGKVMVKLGIVELSTQAIASILKSNAITYLAGGIVQGISAAYLTRIAGLSLIAYYEEQEIANHSKENLNLDQLTDKLKTIFTNNQKANFLQNFVTQTLSNKQLKLS